jgi:D-glycero-D-manno-heptose 1,7-bisphosphate phosphatase
MNRWLSLRSSSVPPRGVVPVLFLDRDGVLLVEKDYLSDPEAVELIPGVDVALRRARAAGFLLIGVSNQSGIGRGLFSHEDFSAVMERFDEILHFARCPLDAFYYCPHAPGDRCNCRKPALGLLVEAARDFSWDPQRSWLVGDKISDIELANAAGLRSILVCTGHGSAHADRLIEEHETRVAVDLPAAVDLILDECAP